MHTYTTFLPTLTNDELEALRKAVNAEITHRNNDYTKFDGFIDGNHANNIEVITKVKGKLLAVLYIRRNVCDSLRDSVEYFNEKFGHLNN